MGEQVGCRGDLLVGDRHPVDVGTPAAVGVAPARIEVQAGAIRGVGPLRPQRGRRAHHDHLLAAGRADGLAGGERLARSRRRDQQEVGIGRVRVRGQERRLPRARREAHGGVPPFARLHGGHSALPLAGAVAPPARTGVT